MFFRCIIYFFLVLTLISCNLPVNKESKVIELKYLDSIAGDFSFIIKWDYPIGVYKNKFGQLSCDWLCPSETDLMKDDSGKIYQDSLKAFYRLIDTTHRHHSLQADVWTYEFAGSNFINAFKKSRDTIFLKTENSVSTHSCLRILIVQNLCDASIELTSITNPLGKKIYTCKTGQINIDKNLLQNNIIKANFNFIFNHPENPNKPMYWRGKIFTKIPNRTS